MTFDLWIGLHDAKKEFQWVNSEPLQYTNWAPGEPSGYGTSAANEKPVSQSPTSSLDNSRWLPACSYPDGSWATLSA